jgi:MFS family permease
MRQRRESRRRAASIQGRSVIPRPAWIRLYGQELPANTVALGFVSLLMAMSSQMIHSLLPILLVTTLGASAASVGLIEAIAEATNSFGRFAAGVVSDWLRRRKLLVVVGYGMAALSKPLFSIADSVGTVLLARFLDRSGKGIRDAPRDALLADELPIRDRGSGFGLRLSLFTIGSVAGPSLASGIMLAGGDIRLVFWVAVVPAFLSVLVLVVAVKEPALPHPQVRTRLSLYGLRELPPAFLWILAIAALLELARFSQAFLLLKAKDVGVEPALIPGFLVLMSAVYGVTAYPFGILADRGNRRAQLVLGALVLLSSHVTLALAESAWGAAAGACLWGLQMGITQGLLAACVADAAPEHLRGTAFGVYYLTDGVVSFLASSGAGLIWSIAGAAPTFALGAALAAAASAVVVMSPRTSVGRVPDIVRPSAKRE